MAETETTQTEDTQEQPSSLPSEAQDNTLDFSLTDDVKEKYLTNDGKILGKYTNLDQLIESHKFLQDKHAMFVDTTKQQEKEISSSVEEEQVKIQQQETLQELLPSFMDNGMQLTDDIKQKAIDAGIDERDLELGALKLKDKVNHVYELVGGKENWENTKAYLATQMSEDDFKKVNQDLMSANSDFTVLGMYNAYLQSNSEDKPSARINGEVGVRSAKGYESKQDLFRDRQYLSTQNGRKDENAQKRYREKLALTNLNALGIKA